MTNDTRERLRIFFRRHQIFDGADPVLVQCTSDNSAQYVPGSIPQDWQEFTEHVSGLDKLEVTWDERNTGGSTDSAEANPGGSNYDKGISTSIVANDAAGKYIEEWLLDDMCGTLNSIDVMITDELCKRKFRNFEIKADNLTEVPYGQPCEYEVKLREADASFHCIHKTFIWDDWQGWFGPGSSKMHPCFLTAIEPRPKLITGARLAFSIFGQTVPIVSWFFNESEDKFRKILDVDNFADAPLIRTFIENVCGKCGMTYDTIFTNPASPYYNTCLFFPLSGAMHENDGSDVSSPSLAYHFENRWDVTLAELLDKLKVLFQAEWYVTPGNRLVFQSRAYFENEIANPILDLTDGSLDWDRETLRITFNGEKKPAYGKYQYTIDGSDQASKEISPVYNDTVGFDGSENNLMLEGNLTRTAEFAPTGAVRDGMTKQDYLIDNISDGENGAYAILVAMAVVLAALLAGILSAGAAAALAGFLGVWAIGIANRANNLRDLFNSDVYSGAVRVTVDAISTPRLLIWDGVSLNQAKMVRTDPAAISPNLYYNPDSVPYLTRNIFQYTPAYITNYPMLFEPWFLGNLYDRFQDRFDNPLKSLQSNRQAEFELELCCETISALGGWSEEFAKIGYFVKIQERPNHDLLARITNFAINYDDETIRIRGQVYRKKQ